MAAGVMRSYASVLRTGLCGNGQLVKVGKPYSTRLAGLIFMSLTRPLSASAAVKVIRPSSTYHSGYISGSRTRPSGDSSPAKVGKRSSTSRSGQSLTRPPSVSTAVKVGRPSTTHSGHISGSRTRPSGDSPAKVGKPSSTSHSGQSLTRPLSAYAAVKIGRLSSTTHSGHILGSWTRPSGEALLNQPSWPELDHTIERFHCGQGRQAFYHSFRPHFRFRTRPSGDSPANVGKPSSTSHSGQSLTRPLSAYAAVKIGRLSSTTHSGHILGSWTRPFGDSSPSKVGKPSSTSHSDQSSFLLCSDLSCRSVTRLSGKSARVEVGKATSTT